MYIKVQKVKKSIHKNFFEFNINKLGSLRIQIFNFKLCVEVNRLHSRVHYSTTHRTLLQIVSVLARQIIEELLSYSKKYPSTKNLSDELLISYSGS